MNSPLNSQVPEQLTSRDLLTSRLSAFLSVWESSAATDTARELLALWAGLRRLGPGKPDSNVDRLDRLVQDHVDQLLTAVCRESLFDVDDWLRRSEDLDRALDEGTEEADELDWKTYDLFRRLDRAALAVWAVEKLDAAGTFRDRLAETQQALAQADNLFTARVDLFVGLAEDVAALLSEACPGLEKAQPELWETLWRHRAIEEERDDLETPPDWPTLLERVRSAGTLCPPDEKDGWRTSDQSSPLLMLAAGGGSAGDALLHRLASVGPDETTTTDPGTIWAHFLAAAYLNTGWQESWREAFFRVETPLTEDWRQRRERVERLHWRHYLGEGVFTLEPRPLRNKEEFLKLLQEFMGKAIMPR